MDVLCNKMNGVKISTNTLVVSNLAPNLSYEQLDLLSESEPKKVLLFLINDNNFKLTLSKCLDVTILIHFMNIFSKIKLLEINELKCVVLDMIYNSKYLENLKISLNNVSEISSRIKLQEFLTNCKVIQELVSNSKSKELLNEIMKSKCIETSDIFTKGQECINDNLETEKMIQMLKNFRISKCLQYDVKKLPYYYKSLTVCPVSSDIISNKVILSPNIMKGSYDSVEHYLDVQFRLLREDFISPMREGIQFYKAMNEPNQDTKKMPNMHMYFRVKVSEKIKKDQETLYKVNFYCKEICSNDSKRFLPESLLIFTNNDFHSMFFAIVIRLNQNMFSPFKTLIIKPLIDHMTIKCNSVFTMAESDTYFLPYKYSMNVLKTLNHDNFPMKSYIVYGKTKPRVPVYLTKSSKMYRINGLRFDILNDNLWPDNKFLELDSAQSIAFKAALTEEFTVIQGPPGTGKTYIGLRIAESIIENLYETNILKNPILIVCYTNHALDQFLEGLIKITKKIIRIGGGCKSDIVKPYVVGNNQTSAKKYLMNSCVVGLTTTGASMRRSLLLDLKPSIVIVEEAAEVLESHVVASLTQFCQHVILIGDHKQLRPRTASFILSKQFNFDVSLFERLVKNGFPCYTLATQHRMRPEISVLMQPIYPFLKDHKSVENRSNIHGVSKNIYFIHHEVHEEKVIGSNSYKNMHEVFFFMEFARYLFRQGYNQSQVTILVTYREQLLELQKIRETSLYLEDFRIECVDSYQGEESDIILLSLVRNNTENNIGFLNIQNRVCVALSRARNGLYIMGNMDNLIHSSVWKDISRLLMNQQLLGNKLILQCEFHQDWIKSVRDGSDFTKVQCSKRCNKKLDCGHYCKQFCHYNDQSHNTMFRCKKHYLRTLPCGYTIKIECWMRFLCFECPKSVINITKKNRVKYS